MISINNYDLAYTIVKKLVTDGKRSSIFPFDTNFTEEELDSIDHISITSNNSCLDLEKLKNLKALHIVGTASSEDTEKHHFDNISRLNELEELSIVNVDQITNIDVSRLRKLKKLIIVNNEYLTSITGLDRLTNLETVVICGNSIDYIPNIRKYIRNTINTQTNVLDVLIYNNTFAKRMEDEYYLEEKVNENMSNIKFGEMLEFNNECYNIEYYQMKEMSKKINSIISSLDIDKHESEMSIAFKVYNYVVNNVKYDYDGLDYRDSVYESDINLSDLKNSYIKRRVLSINSSYNALMNKKSVCDGYVNMMRILLDRYDIKTKKVLCSFNEDLSLKLNHVAIKAKIGSEWRYFDPEKERLTKDNRYFALSYEEFLKTHTMESSEQLFAKTKQKRK